MNFLKYLWIKGEDSKKEFIVINAVVSALQFIPLIALTCYFILSNEFSSTFNFETTRDTPIILILCISIVLLLLSMVVSFFCNAVFPISFFGLSIYLIFGTPLFDNINTSAFDIISVIFNIVFCWIRLCAVCRKVTKSGNTYKTHFLIEFLFCCQLATAIGIPPMGFFTILFKIIYLFLVLFFIVAWWIRMMKESKIN